MNFESGAIIAVGMEDRDSTYCSKHEETENVSAYGSVTDKGEGSSGIPEVHCTYKRRRYKRLRLDSKLQQVGIAINKVDIRLDEQECIAVDKDRQAEPAKSNLMPDEPHSTIKSPVEAVSNGHMKGFNHHTAKSSLKPDEPHVTIKSPIEAVSNGHIYGLHNHTITERCRRTFYNVISSEKFAALCNLLCENFKGIKDEKLFGLKDINRRMREGIYEHSPSLFLQDIQQLWRKLEVIGTEVISLATCLSKMSDNSYKELVIGHPQCTREDGKYERGDGDAQRARSCRRCGGIPHGRDYLICDSCEDMYHVSCIEPPLKEIPSTDWYCTTCTIRGVRTTCTPRTTCLEVIHSSKEIPHGSCVVCEKLKAMGVKLDGICNEAIPTNEETSEQLKISSETFKDGSLCLCKVCGSEVAEIDGNLLCDHPYCPNKYYHSSCMTPKELEVVHGSLWYCPACLCRTCLTDKDDEKIVLCDGCDHAYHIYCMKPPRDAIPEGKWFCIECDKGNQVTHEMKAVDHKQKLKGLKNCTHEKLGKKNNLCHDKSSVK